ncbi:unnamed protein product [Urochloa humidicola]
MMNKEYLQNAATEIKAKVIEFDELSDSRKDKDLDGIFDETDSEEDDGYKYKDERECGFDIEMREDDCYDSKEREDDAHDPHNESRDYTCEEKRPETSYISGTQDLKMTLGISCADLGLVSVVASLPLPHPGENPSQLGLASAMF